MGHLGKQEPDIQSVILNNNTLASGQVVVFAEDAAISGIVTVGTAGPGVAFVNPSTGQVMSVVYSKDVGGFGIGGSVITGMFDEFSGAQTGFYHGNNRIFFMNAAGINLQERQLLQFLKGVTSSTVGGAVATQSTGGLFDNIGATGVITFNLTDGGQRGHIHEFYNMAGFPMRLNPGSGAHFITPTGVMTDNTYLELTSVGAYVRVVKNVQLDWMVVGQLGDVNPE